MKHEIAFHVKYADLIVSKDLHSLSLLVLTKTLYLVSNLTFFRNIFCNLLSF